MEKLRGNTFIALLLRSGIQELSERPEWGENSNGKTLPNLFADLLRMTQPSYNPPKPKTLSSYFSQYMKGNLPFSPMYFAFNTSAFQHGLSLRIQDEYPIVLSEMDHFYRKYLRTSDVDRRLLVGGLVDVILEDESFIGEFDVGARWVDKEALREEQCFILQPFLVSVWNSILMNHPDASEAKDTYASWTNQIHGKPDEVITDIGSKRAKKIAVSDELPKEAASNTAEVKVKLDEPVLTEPKQSGLPADQTLNNSGRIFNQHAEKIVNIENVETLYI